MSEITLLSNQSSSLLASSYAGQGPEMSEYIYDMPRSTINRFKDRMISTKLNGAAWGEQQSLEIPSFGVLNRMVLKTEFTVARTLAPNVSTIKKALFARIIDEVAIMNSSRRIMTLTGDTIQYLVYGLHKDEREKWLIAGMDNAVTDENGSKFDDAAGVGNGVPARGADANTPGTASKVVVYTLLPFSCFKEGGAKHGPFKSNFNTRFCEKLSLTIKLSNKTDWLPDAETGWTISDPTVHLLSDFDIIEQKSLLSIEEKNYSLSQNLAQVMSDFNLVKTVSTYTAGSPIGLQIFNTQLCHSLIITLEATGTSVTLNPEEQYMPIKAIKLTSAGRVIYETENQLESLLLGSQDSYMGNCWSTAVVPTGQRDRRNIYVINFANDGKDTSKINGCAALKNLNSLKLEVTPQGPAGTAQQANYTLKCYVRFYQAIATSAQSGRISISLSS